MKKIFVLVSGAIIICGALAVWVLWGGLRGRVLESVSPSVVTHVPISTSSSYVAVSGAYPRISNTSPAFNEHIATVVHDAQLLHEREATENWKSRFAMQMEDGAASAEPAIDAVPSDDQKMQFSVAYTIVRNDEQYVSLVLRYGGYTGGAHGYEDIATFTFDRAKGREITLDDVYTPDQLVAVAARVRPLLISRLARSAQQKENEIDAQWVNEGTDPSVPENYARFTLSSLSSQPGEHITFYFGQYQVAAYVFGDQEVTIPREVE